MRNVVFTQLSIPEFRKLIREEMADTVKNLVIDKILPGLHRTEKFINKEEAALLAGVHISTIESWIERGHLKIYDFNNAHRIKFADLILFLESRIISKG